MSRRTKVEKYGIIALAAACVLLGFKLVSEISGSTETARAEDRPAQTAPSAAASNKHNKAIGKLAKADPDLEIQALKEYTSRPLPSNTRNPFDFGAAPVARSGRGGTFGAPGRPGAGGAAPPSPPPPPQIALRAIGYSLRAGVGGEAYLADGDQVYVVHQGNLLSKRYKILRITSSVVEVHDQSTGETVQLPIPQVQ